MPEDTQQEREVPAGESDSGGLPAGWWAGLGVVFVFFVGSAVHSLYHAIGEPLVLAWALPVNESPWEHLKMAYLPTIAWGVLGLATFDLDRERLPLAVGSAIVTMMALVLGIFYSYTVVLGTNVLLLDALTFLIAAIGGMWVALVVLDGAGAVRDPRLAGSILVVMVGLVFATFTFYPPHLPPFLDSLSGTYGV